MHNAGDAASIRGVAGAGDSTRGVPAAGGRPRGLSEADDCIRGVPGAGIGRDWAVRRCRRRVTRRRVFS